MHPPENIYTAITAATYISLKIARPNEDITIKDKEDKSRTFYIGQSKQVDILPLEELMHDLERNNCWLHIQTDKGGVYLCPDKDGYFRVAREHSTSDHSYQDGLSTLQRKIETALNRTGFTPTNGFGRGNLKNLEKNGFLFNKEKWDEHRDSLFQRFPRETEQYLKQAREIDVNTMSISYLNELVNENCLQLPYFGTRIPYSNLKRGALVMGGLGISGLIAASKIIPGTEQFSQFYNDLLFNNGIISAVAANAATMSFFYALGDLSAQFIEGRGFDGKRLVKFSCLGAAYGAEFSGFYSLLNPIRYSTKFISSLIKGAIDSGLYGVGLFNSRHLYLASKENISPIDYFRFDKIFSSFKNSDFRKKWKTLSSYTLLFWLPYQVWNRFKHELPQQVSYVALATPPFTVFLSLVSNEKKELDEFMKVMASLNS